MPLSPDEKCPAEAKKPKTARRAPAKPKTVAPPEPAPVADSGVEPELPEISEERIFREYALIALDRETKTPDRMRALEWLYEYLTASSF